MPDVPGTEDAAYLSFSLLNRLLKSLVVKGILTPEELIALLEEFASDLSQDRRAVAQRSVGYVRNTMIPEHKLSE